MRVHGLPETFWVVTRPFPFSELRDIFVPYGFEELLRQARAGLHEDDIVSIHGNEEEARSEAIRLLGRNPVRPQDAVGVDVVVHVLVQPLGEGLTARELGEAAVEAVLNAVHGAEKHGHRHHLEGRVSLCMSQAAELDNLQTAVGQAVSRQPGCQKEGEL
jgi:hypothetical protein